MTIGLGVIALGAVVVAVLALRAEAGRSDRVDELTGELATVTGQRDELAVEVERVASESATNRSRWLSAVAVSGDFSPRQSRLLAVEAGALSPGPDATAAIGQLLFADPRTKPPIIELAHDGPVWVTGAGSTADVVATGSDDTTVKLWSPTGELQATLPHGDRLRALDFSADDQRIVTGSGDGAVAVWTGTGEPVAEGGHTDQVNDVAISGDGALAVSGAHDGVALVLESETGQVRHELAHPDIVWAVDLAPDASRVTTGGQDGLARIWDLDTGAELTVHDLGEPVTRVDYSTDGSWLLLGGQSSTAILVDAATGDPLPPLEGSFVGGILDTAWHPDGGEMAVVSLSGISRFELPTGAPIEVHKVAGGSRGVAYGPDGSWFVTGSGDFQFFFGEIAFWDTESGQKLANLNLGGPVESVSVQASGTVVAGFRTTVDMVEVGGAWLVPGPGRWVALACEGTDATISEETWSQLTGEPTERRTDCP